MSRPSKSRKARDAKPAPKPTKTQLAQRLRDETRAIKQLTFDVITDNSELASRVALYRLGKSLRAIDAVGSYLESGVES